MKIQIFSDLHLGMNDISPKDIIKPADLYIDAGDTGELGETINFYTLPIWNDKKVFFVSGNHTYYFHEYEPTNNLLKLTFKNSKVANVSFLQNRYCEYDDFVIIGATLWTDYNLFRQPVSDMIYCQNRINDYNFIQITDKIKLTPEHTTNLFKYSLSYLKKTVRKFHKKRVIIVTHHAPSDRSCLEEYRTDHTSAAFVSSLENFILDNPNIKLWIHGHVHNANDYMIGDTRIISNPYGYQAYGESRNYKAKIIDF